MSGGSVTRARKGRGRALGLLAAVISLAICAPPGLSARPAENAARPAEEKSPPAPRPDPGEALDPETGKLIEEGVKLQAAGEFDKALEKLRAAIDRLDESRQPLRLAELLGRQGACHAEAGRPAEAEKAARREVAIRKRIQGEEHLDTLTALNNLAMTFQDQGKLEEARPLYTQVLEARRRLQGNKHADTLTSINNLASLLWAQGKLREAEPLYVEGLAVAREVLGEADLMTFIVTNNLATLLQLQGKLADAEPLYVRALEGFRRLLGEEHPNTIILTNNLASLLRALDRPEEARPLFEKALLAARRVFGERHFQTITFANNLGRVLFGLGRLEEAKETFRRTLAAARDSLGEEHAVTLAAMDSLADVLRTEGLWNEAEVLYRRILEAGRKTKGEEHPDVLACMLNLAGTLEAQARFGEAEELCVKALETSLRAQGEEHPQSIAAASRLGSLRQSQGQFQEAERLRRSALERARRLFGEEHTSTLRLMNDLGASLYSQGMLAEAETLFTKSLDCHLRLLGLEHPTTLAAMNNLAALLYEQGRLRRAEVLYRKSLAARGRALGEENPDVLTGKNNLADLLWTQGNLDEALSLASATLAVRRRVFGESHPDTALSRNTVGRVYLALGRLEEAEPLLTEALAHCRQHLGEEHATTLTVMNDLANLRDRMGKPREAEALLRRTLGIRRRVLGEEHNHTLGSMNNLGAFLRGHGDLAGAEELFAKTLATQMQTLGAEHFHTLASMANLARVFRARGKLDEAKRLLGEVVERSESARAGILGDERERALYSKALDFSGLAADLAYLHFQGGSPEAAFLVSERGRGRMLLDLLGRAERDAIREARGAGRAGEAARLEAALRVEEEAAAAVRRLEEVAASRGAGRKPDAGQNLASPVEERRALLQARTAQWEASHEVLVFLQSLCPEVKAAEPGAIRAALGAAEWILSYTWTEAFVFSLLVPPVGAGEIEGFVIADGREAVAGLAARAEEFRTWLLERGAASPPAGGAGETERLERCGALFRQLLPPAAWEKVKGAGEIVILAEGPIAGLPFEALPTAPGASARETRFFLDDGPPASYCASGSVLLNRREARRRRLEAGTRSSRPSAVLLADPAYGSGGAELGAAVENLALLEGREGEAPAASVLDFLRLRGTELRRLPGSALEARSIARLIREAGGEPELLLGSEATLARLQAAVEGKTYVHLATHGFMGSRAHPDHASLALARPEGGAGDLGFLTLEHLLGSWRGKLAGCELAVLSACDSNAGKEEGDAFLALPWGFLYAGASAVLASLWKVDDRATSLFMARFYENLLVRRMAKAAALREARLWLRRLTGRQALSSYRGLFLDETARVLEERRERAEREKDASRPSFKDETEAALAEEPYAHPFFWAGFVLVGDAS